MPEDKGLQVQGERAPATMLEAVMREVSNPATDPARLREFLEIGKELQAMDAKKQFTMAMAEMRPELPTIKKNGLIIRPPNERSKGSQTAFAKWDDVHRACMPILDKHGFSCSFGSPELQGGNVLKVTMLVRHIGGHEDTSSMFVPWQDTGGSKSPAQAAISSETIAQRHVFIKYFNILTEDVDDDGTGKGVPERITEEQAMGIEDILSECENREKGMRGRFGKWLKAEFQADSPAGLFQGQQFESVMKFLARKQRDLGI